MTDTPPLLCQVTGCTRVAHWCVTGEDFGGEVLYRGLSCDAPQHQAMVKQLAWQEYSVVALVKLRRIDKGQGSC